MASSLSCLRIQRGVSRTVHTYIPTIIHLMRRDMVGGDLTLVHIRQTSLGFFEFFKLSSFRIFEFQAREKANVHINLRASLEKISFLRERKGERSRKKFQSHQLCVLQPTAMFSRIIHPSTFTYVFYLLNNSLPSLSPVGRDLMANQH